MQDDFWQLWCDGASRGNPGPAGAGAVLRDPRGRERGLVSTYLGQTTNNVAEYQALLLGLELARQQGATRLRVLMDSQLVIRQLQGSYRVRQPHLRPLYEQARQWLEQLDDYQLVHVPREHNREADRLANQGIDCRD